MGVNNNNNNINNNINNNNNNNNNNNTDNNNGNNFSNNKCSLSKTNYINNIDTDKTDDTINDGNVTIV